MAGRLVASNAAAIKSENLGIFNSFQACQPAVNHAPFGAPNCTFSSIAASGHASARARQLGTFFDSDASEARALQAIGGRRSGDLKSPRSLNSSREYANRENAAETGDSAMDDGGNCHAPQRSGSQSIGIAASPWPSGQSSMTICAQE
jgi:hypothetical protein